MITINIDLQAIIIAKIPLYEEGETIKEIERKIILDLTNKVQGGVIEKAQGEAQGEVQEEIRKEVLGEVQETTQGDLQKAEENILLNMIMNTKRR